MNVHSKRKKESKRENKRKKEGESAKVTEKKILTKVRRGNNRKATSTRGFGDTEW